MKISGTYSPTKWDEKPYSVIEDRMKLTRAEIEFTFEGDLEGKSSLHYLMFYDSFDDKDAHKASARYVGLHHFVGKLKGGAGTFAMEDHGTYAQGAARSELTILPHSGTGIFKKISGRGHHGAGKEGCHWQLEISL